MFYKRQNSFSRYFASEGIMTLADFCLRRQNRQVCQLFSGPCSGRFEKKCPRFTSV